MSEPYRDLHLRFHTNSGWVESLTSDDRIALSVDLLRLARSIASEPQLARDVLDRPIDVEVQRTFADVVGVLRELYDLGQNREPSLEEMTSALHELLPWMSHEEMMRRLREVAKEVMA
jgi:hypothetical protein